VHKCIHKYIYVYKYIHIYPYMYIHVYKICTHMCIYIYVCMHRRVGGLSVVNEMDPAKVQVCLWREREREMQSVGVYMCVFR